MYKRALTSSILILLFGLGTAHGADEFCAHFHDPDNVEGYITSIDALIDSGEGRPYASPKEEKEDENSPQVKTANGIFMLYSVTNTEEGVLIHFSVSRPPYLATPFGKHITGLFLERSGWPEPMHFMVSENQVFHSLWLVPTADFNRVKEQLPELRKRIRANRDFKDVFLKALLASASLGSTSNQAVDTTSR